MQFVIVYLQVIHVLGAINATLLAAVNLLTEAVIQFLQVQLLHGVLNPRLVAVAKTPLRVPT